MQDTKVTVELTLVFLPGFLFLPSKAASLLREAADKLQDNPVIYYHLGMTQIKKGDPVEAKKALNTALKLSDRFQGVEEARKALEEL